MYEALFMVAGAIIGVVIMSLVVGYSGAIRSFKDPEDGNIYLRLELSRELNKVLRSRWVCLRIIDDSRE